MALSVDENLNTTELGMEGFLTEAHCPDGISIQTRPLTDVYTVETRPFARGKFATVRRCRHKETGCDFAAKYIRKRRRAVDVRHEIVHEVYVLKLSHTNPRIVRLHEVYETPSELILVLEMAAGGELQRVLDDEETISENDTVRLMRQILEGLSFLHEHSIAHLDIKPQNILLTRDFPKCDIKLCDFGISRLVTGGVEIREICGTPDYVAPEILHYEPINLATDMWSIGVLAYVLLCGHTPFGGENKQETFCNITHGEVEFPEDMFGHISNAAKDFIRRLLVKDPRSRMTVKESLQHTWLRPDLSISSQLISRPCAPSCMNSSLSSPHIELNGEVDRHNKPLPLQQQNGIIENGGSHSVKKLELCSRTSNGPNTLNEIRQQCSQVKTKEINLNSAERSNVKSVREVENMVVEIDGLSLTNRLIFSEEIIVDERVGIVY